MPANKEQHRWLLHRLNGQLLESLNDLLKSEIEEKWNIEDWIINMIMLRRTAAEPAYSARLLTSATYHKGNLYCGPKDFDPKRGVKDIDREVPLNGSFSGYATITSDIVWISNLDSLETIDKSSKKPKLAHFYRDFSHVRVSTPEGRPKPKAEFVFPILHQTGLNHTVLGVLNMEYFGVGNCPFEDESQLLISDAITELLNAHSPFILVASLPETRDLVESGAEKSVIIPLITLHGTILRQYKAKAKSGEVRLE